MRGAVLCDRKTLLSLQIPGKVRLAVRLPEPVPRLPTGISALDALLDGGLPRGSLTEIVGPPCSGRTALACALTAAATGAGEAVVWVDLPDALHPDSLLRNGADLDRVLWIRPPSLRVALQGTEVALCAGGFPLVLLDLGIRAGHVPRPVWPRLLGAARRSRASLVLLTPGVAAGSFAALRLAVSRQRVFWGSAPRVCLDSLTLRAVVARNRQGRSGGAMCVEARAP